MVATTSSLLLASLAGLVGLVQGGVASTVGQNPITDDTYFYGDSPPVYPAPASKGLGWSAAFKKATDMVEKMSLDQKIALTGGVPSGDGCGGYLQSVSPVGFPGFCLHDSGNGVRFSDFVSAFPTGLHVGASFNKKLTNSRAHALGKEFFKKGVNVMLGPVVGPIGRTKLDGRTWEGMGADPYLAGALATETVQGTQSAGVIACIKHFVGNEQETNRTALEDGTEPNSHAVSSNIDDVGMHELYLWPFQDAVHAGTGSVMCSYQRTNNSYSCQNSKLLNGLLKTELGFQGFVLSDWGAQHGGVASALAGLDVVMPSADPLWGAQLRNAVKNGSVPEARITDMVTRVLTTWYQHGQDTGIPHPGIGMVGDQTSPHQVVDARDLNDRPILLQGAIEGHVLVKNKNNALPFKKPRHLSLYGYSAKSPDINNPSKNASLIAQFGLAMNSIDVFKYLDNWPDNSLSVIAPYGNIYSGGGSGGTTPNLAISPFDAIKWKASQDNIGIYHDFTRADPNVESATDACIVFGNAWSNEGFDRPALHDDYTDGLIMNVASQCANTIVIFHNTGPRLVDVFVNHANISAIIFAHMPGQESGTALVSLLWGESNAWGKLPYTVAKNETDYGSLYAPSLPGGKYAHFPQANFVEGVYTDYKYFNREKTQPRYAFGFGLSYTSFQLRHLTVDGSRAEGAGRYPTGKIIPGGRADLWDTILTANVTLTNTGQVEGAEVAQLYVGIPNGPEKQLRGFEKVTLKPGASSVVSFQLTRRDLSTWDTKAQAWSLQKGTYQIYVGSSSDDSATHVQVRI